MSNFMSKTFGGLTREYYFRQLFFGFILAAAMFWLKTAVHPVSVGLIIWLTVNTLLYPYARFVWESCIGFILGQNMFLIPAIVLLVAKLITMFLCWQMAVLIAPIGLAWLYWHHGRQTPA